MTVSKIHAMDLFADMLLGSFVTSDSNWRTHFPSNKGPPKKQDDSSGEKMAWWDVQPWSFGPAKTIRGFCGFQPINGGVLEIMS